jgi:hypothetical protein
MQDCKVMDKHFRGGNCRTTISVTKIIHLHGLNGCSYKWMELLNELAKHVVPALALAVGANAGVQGSLLRIHVAVVTQLFAASTRRYKFNFKISIM